MATPARNERRGPEVFLHLEFSVSWGGKKQPAKNHQITYRSRGVRERATAFPRQVPAPNTNYLAAIHNFDSRQTRVREWREDCASSPNRHHQLQEYYQGQQPAVYLQIPEIREPEPEPEPEPERPTRADAPSSHGRGRSAPPPLGENPWDVKVSQDRARASDLDHQWGEARQKPLPAAPSEFRLGDGGQPWSNWSLPDGYDPDLHPKDGDDDDDDTNNPRNRNPDGLAPRPDPVARNSVTYATNPTIVSVFSPEPVPRPRPPPPARDAETGRARELGALSAAMMTVDNGFENQWWNRGSRATVYTDDAPRTPDDSPVQRWSTGPMRETPPATPVFQPPPSPQPPSQPQPPSSGVVSPMTEAARSPALQSASLLQRTMSTRSEELWFRERG
ncbi:hypothetical protein BT67DRAFT_232637 [Trichocladium antarcticum]|uniref:Uncharacterized protein n=1 Tax=Trichocladium antarcticum TaxID=1450529 RepID=A0AAN6UNV8_9PEZI|nr:hypothetical protein BT67DRAFT_232637 [Trichocladium antarcticum]